MNQRKQPEQSLLGRLMTVREVARELGVSHHTIYSWVSQRRIPFLKIGRLLRFDATAIAQWLRERAEPTVPLERDASPELESHRCVTCPERRT